MQGKGVYAPTGLIQSNSASAPTEHFDCAAGNAYKTAERSANLTLYVLNFQPGIIYTIEFVQGASGGKTLTISGLTFTTALPNVEQSANATTWICFTIVRGTIAALVSVTSTASATNDVLASSIQTSLIHSQDALNPGDNTLGLLQRAGRSSINGISNAQPWGNYYCWGNIIVEHGCAGRDTNGETLSINSYYGDTRLPAVFPQGEYIGHETGYFGVQGYDADPTTGIERTPYSWRDHTGYNPDTGKQIGWLCQGYRDVVIESVVGPVQINTINGQSFVQAYTLTSGHTAFMREPAFYTSTTGAVNSDVSLGELIEQGHLASVDIMIVCLASDFSTFEHFRIKMSAFRSTAPAVVIGDLGSVGGYPAIAGRVTAFDNSGQIAVRVTGVAGKTLYWGIFPTVKVLV